MYFCRLPGIHQAAVLHRVLCLTVAGDFSVKVADDLHPICVLRGGTEGAPSGKASSRANRIVRFMEDPEYDYFRLISVQSPQTIRLCERLKLRQEPLAA